LMLPRLTLNTCCDVGIELLCQLDATTTHTEHLLWCRNWAPVSTWCYHDSHWTLAVMYASQGHKITVTLNQWTIENILKISCLVEITVKCVERSLFLNSILHVWSSFLCCGCASNLEFTVGWTAKPGSPQCHLPTQLKDVSVSTIPGALSALEVLCDYALYKSTFTLHYTGSAAP